MLTEKHIAEITKFINDWDRKETKSMSLTDDVDYATVTLAVNQNYICLCTYIETDVPAEGSGNAVLIRTLVAGWDGKSVTLHPVSVSGEFAQPFEHHSKILTSEVRNLVLDLLF